MEKASPCHTNTPLPLPNRPSNFLQFKHQTFFFKFPNLNPNPNPNLLRLRRLNCSVSDGTVPCKPRIAFLSPAVSEFKFCAVSQLMNVVAFTFLFFSFGWCHGLFFSCGEGETDEDCCIDRISCLVSPQRIIVRN